jgi:UPF0271 protein
VTARISIDLNADVGERFGHWQMGDDAGLLEHLTSASVACGFHAGDPTTMRETCERALECKVQIGAHVGYRDLAGFGRRSIDVSPTQLHDEVAYQIGALMGCAQVAGGAVGYVKPHGALYHRCSGDSEAAAGLVEAVCAADSGLRIVGPPGSALLFAAERQGLIAVPEGFADRAYEPGGQLRPRGRAGAVLDPRSAICQAHEIVAHGTVTARDGSVQPLAVRTLCVHGDTPGAVELLRSVRAALERDGVIVERFS